MKNKKTICIITFLMIIIFFSSKYFLNARYRDYECLTLKPAIGVEIELWGIKIFRIGDKLPPSKKKTGDISEKESIEKYTSLEVKYAEKILHGKTPYIGATGDEKKNSAYKSTIQVELDHLDHSEPRKHQYCCPEIISFPTTDEKLQNMRKAIRCLETAMCKYGDYTDTCKECNNTREIYDKYAKKSFTCVPLKCVVQVYHKILDEKFTKEDEKNPSSKAEYWKTAVTDETIYLNGENGPGERIAQTNVGLPLFNIGNKKTKFYYLARKDGHGGDPIEINAGNSWNDADDHSRSCFKCLKKEMIKAGFKSKVNQTDFENDLMGLLRIIFYTALNKYDTSTRANKDVHPLMNKTNIAEAAWALFNLHFENDAKFLALKFQEIYTDRCYADCMVYKTGKNYWRTKPVYKKKKCRRFDLKCRIAEYKARRSHDAGIKACDRWTSEQLKNYFDWIFDFAGEKEPDPGYTFPYTGRYVNVDWDRTLHPFKYNGHIYMIFEIRNSSSPINNYFQSGANEAYKNYLIELQNISGK